MTDTYYRVLISAPISAENDDEARSKADQLAGQIESGHTEMVVETQPGVPPAGRVIFVDPHLAKQIP
jgi:hypothetical protein